MRELTFIVPHLPGAMGDHSLAVHSTIQRALRRVFGGYSQHMVHGSWLDDRGLVHDDTSAAYTVAANWTRKQRREIDELIWTQVHARLDQMAVYVRRPDGVVRIIEKGESVWPWWRVLL